MRSRLIVAGFLLAQINAYALEESSSKGMKTFECKGVYYIKTLRLNAPNAEVAVGLYQIAAVLPEKQGGSTFSGPSFDLTEKDITCIDVTSK